MASSLLIPRQQQDGWHCTGADLEDTIIQRIGARETIAAISYNATNSSNITAEPIVDVFRGCCEPNAVYRVEGDCLLWCDVPEEFLEDDEPHKAFLEKCLGPGREENAPDWEGDFGVWEADFFESAAVVAGGPSVMGVLLLVTLLVSFAV